MENYIDRIKKKKAERKLTNEQLSARSGIPLGTLSKMLAGMANMRNFLFFINALIAVIKCCNEVGSSCVRFLGSTNCDVIRIRPTLTITDTHANTVNE